MKPFYFWNENTCSTELNPNQGQKCLWLRSRVQKNVFVLGPHVHEREMGDLALILHEKNKDDVDFWA